MIDLIKEETFEQLSRLLSEKIGLYFPVEKKHDLERELKNVCAQFGVKNISELAEMLVSSNLNKSQIEILGNALTIGETYFLREKKIFEILEQNILPQIINAKKEKDKSLTIWSAGCSTGEEVYSIAMIIDKLGTLFNGWDIKIIGTDISTKSLKKAEGGVYNQWSFRTCPSYIIDKYFTQKENQSYLVSKNLRKKIQFSYFNLTEESSYKLFLPESIDIIFCRNVMMYFNEETRKKVIQKFKGLLINKGWLIVSSSEISSGLQPHFKSVNFTNAILYTKDNTYHSPKPYKIQESFTSIDPIINNINYQSITNKQRHPKTILINTASPEKFLERKEIEIIKSAEELFDKGKFAEVILLLEKTLNDSNCYLLTEELEKTYLIISKGYANLGKLMDARKWCEKAIAVSKMNYSTYYLLANILMEDGLKDEAVVSLRKALFLDPNFILAMFSLGNILLKQGKWNEARKQFENALSILSKFVGHELVPESDGLTVSHLREIIQSTIKSDIQR